MAKEKHSEPGEDRLDRIDAIEKNTDGVSELKLLTNEELKLAASSLAERAKQHHLNVENNTEGISDLKLLTTKELLLVASSLAERAKQYSVSQIDAIGSQIDEVR